MGGAGGGLNGSAAAAPSAAPSPEEGPSPPPRTTSGLSARRQALGEERREGRAVGERAQGIVPSEVGEGECRTYRTPSKRLVPLGRGEAVEYRASRLEAGES